MTDPQSERAGLRPDRAIVDPMAVSPAATRGALVPTSGAEALEMARMMAVGRFSMPRYLQGNPGDCLRIVAISMRTGLDPWMLADDSYQTESRRNGEIRMAFGAKSIHAIVLASGVLAGDLELSFSGQGENLTCTVTGQRRGGHRHTATYALRTISVKNSPLWKDQPPQQLGYYSERAWCRLHAPDAIMGLVAREEAGMLDITDSVIEEPPPSDLEKVRASLATSPPQDGPAPAPEAPPPPAEADASGAPASEPPSPGAVDPPDRAAIQKVAREVATLGRKRLSQYCSTLPGATWPAVQEIEQELEQIADAADQVGPDSMTMPNEELQSREDSDGQTHTWPRR